MHIDGIRTQGHSVVVTDGSTVPTSVAPLLGHTSQSVPIDCPP